MLIFITNAKEAAVLAGRPFQQGQVTTLDDSTTAAMLEAGCAEPHTGHGNAPKREPATGKHKGKGASLVP